MPPHTVLTMPELICYGNRHCSRLAPYLSAEDLSPRNELPECVRLVTPIAPQCYPVCLALAPYVSELQAGLQGLAIASTQAQTGSISQDDVIFAFSVQL